MADKPTGFKISGVKNLKMSNNSSHGFEVGFDVQNVENMEGGNNVAIAPAEPQATTQPRLRAFYERPVGIIVLGVFASVVFWAIGTLLDWF